MNDFTKEDLLTMRQCLRMAYKSGFDPEDGLPTAFYCYDKIRIMIENYCEKHESDELDNPDFCKHCDRRFR